MANTILGGQGIRMGGFNKTTPATYGAYTSTPTISTPTISTPNLATPTNTLSKAPKAPGLSGGQIALGSLGAAMQAVNLGFGIWNQFKQDEYAQDQLKLARDQLETEKNRWDEREKERKKHNEIINASADLLPTERY